MDVGLRVEQQRLLLRKATVLGSFWRSLRPRELPKAFRALQKWRLKLEIQDYTVAISRCGRAKLWEDVSNRGLARLFHV